MLRSQLLKRKEYFKELSKGQSKYVFLVSYCNGKKQAVTWTTRAQKFDTAWNKVERYLSKISYTPLWLVIEIVTHSEKLSPKMLAEQIKSSNRSNYFRKGISFDNDFYLTISEANLNANALYVFDAESQKPIDSFSKILNAQNTQLFLSKMNSKPVYLNLDTLDYVHAFETTGIFFEGNNNFILHDHGYKKGTRLIPEKELLNTLEEVIKNGEDFIQRQQILNGKFIYGYYPALNRVLTSYNAVRHFSTIYAWTEAVEYLHLNIKNCFLEKSLDWGLQEMTLEKDNALFVVEKNKDNLEIKLGSNAMALLALIKYTEYSGTNKYDSAMDDLYNGLRKMYDSNGESTHVFDEDLNEKEKFRIVYYEGEALFSLTKYYQYTKREEILVFIKTIFQRLIKEKYYKYHDHWLSYATNQIMTICPERKYAEFGLKNVLEHLDFIKNRDTAYPTLLELLVSSRKMIETIRNDSELETLITENDILRLEEIMNDRVYHELGTGTFLPEVAMYFLNPQRIIGGFFARHDNFRTRIDDAEHFLSGFINFAKLMD